MTARATVTVDLAKIADNARTVVSALSGVEIIGVTKVTCGSPEIARAMLAGGVVGHRGVAPGERGAHAGRRDRLPLLVAARAHAGPRRGHRAPDRRVAAKRGRDGRGTRGR